MKKKTPQNWLKFPKSDKNAKNAYILALNSDSASQNSLEIIYFYTSLQTHIGFFTLEHIKIGQNRRFAHRLRTAKEKYFLNLLTWNS